MLSQSRNRAPAATASSASAVVVTSTWTSTSGYGAADRGVRRRQRAGRELVVVLDHRDVVQAHPLVGAAAAAHGVLLQGPQPGRGLAGVEHRRAGALERVGPAPGVRGDAGEPADEVEQGALADQRGPRWSPRRTARTSPRRTGSPSARRRGSTRTSADPSRRPPRRRPARPAAARPTTPSARATTCAVLTCRPGWWPAVVTSTPSGPPRSSSRAVPTTASGRRASGKRCRSSSSRGLLVGTARPRRGPRRRRDRSVVIRTHGRVCAAPVARRSSSRSGKSERHVAAAGLLARRATAVSDLADVQQVGGLPVAAVPRRRAAGPRRRWSAAARAASSAAVAPATSAERTAPGPRSSPRWIAVRSVAPSERRRPLAQPRRSPRGSSPAASRAVMSSAIRWAKTRPSSSELEASRLAPCTPVQDTSPQAYRPVEGGPAVQVGADPAAGVVLGRGDRQQVGGRVEAELAAAGDDRAGSGARGTRRPRCRASR